MHSTECSSLCMFKYYMPECSSMSTSVVSGWFDAAPFLVHCLSEKRKQPDENSRAVYQPYRHLQNSLESNGSDGPASVEMSSLLEDRGLVQMLLLLN